MKRIMRYIKFIFGVFLVAFSFNLFLMPDGMSSSGVTGLSVLANHLFGIDPFIFILIVNLLLVGISFILLGKAETTKTIVGSILYPIFIKLTVNITSLMSVADMDLLSKAIAGGILFGIGNGMIFKNGFTTGGSDIIEAIIVRYARIPMNKAIFITEGFISLLVGLILGVDYFIYAIVILIFNGSLSNKLLVGINDDKVLFITSDKYKVIKKYLIDAYNYGITLLDAHGGYSNEKEKIIMVSVKKSFYREIKDAIFLIDKNAFITVLNSYETEYIDKEYRTKLRKI